MFLFTQLQKELGVHMDLKISYDDPTAILFPGWNLCSRMFLCGRHLLLPLHMLAGLHCRRGAKGALRMDWSLLSPDGMLECHC